MAFAFLVGLSWFGFKQYRHRMDCKQRDAASEQLLERIERDARDQLKRGTKLAGVKRFFAEHNIPFHSANSYVSGGIRTPRCGPLGCDSAAALIGVRVELDADGTVNGEPTVTLALVTNCQ